MKETVDFIEVNDTEAKRYLVIVKESTGDYILTLIPPVTVERVRERSVGKRIKEFMKEKNGKQEKTNR